MSEIIEKVAQQQSDAAIAPVPETPQAAAPAQGGEKSGERAAGAAVSAAAKLFGRFNNLDGEPKKKEGGEAAPSKDGKPSTNTAAGKKKEDAVPADAPENPIFGKKKSKKQEAVEIKDAIREGNRELIEAISQPKPPANPEPVAAPAPELSKSDSRLHEQLKKLEEINPEYKDVSSKFIDFKKKEAAYEADWIANNPDEDFDPDSDEHQKFYKKNEPHIDGEDLDLAKEALADDRVERRAREVAEKEIGPLKAERNHQQVVERLAPKLSKTFEQVAREAASQINPELGSIKDLNKVAESDPLAAQILNGVAEHWFPVIQTAEYAYSGARFDPNSAEGLRLGQVVTEIESGYSSLSKADQAKDGKQFATLAEFSKLSAADRSRHWHVGAEEITAYASYRMKVDSKKFYAEESDRIDKMASSRGYVRNTAPNGKQEQVQNRGESTGSSGFRPAPAIGGGSSAPAPTALRPDPEANPRTRVGKRLGWA